MTHKELVASIVEQVRERAALTAALTAQERG